jgi:hypothetical protein
MYKDGLYKTCESSLVPKFGDWDATDPSSGIGFTAVFERVMDEKKRGGCAYVAPTPSTFRSASSQKVETLNIFSTRTLSQNSQLSILHETVGKVRVVNSGHTIRVEYVC